jgi:hypothetical protein
MKLFWFALIFLLASLLGATPLQPAGSGTQAAPYQIAILANLEWTSQNSASWGSWFIQTADINASATSGWNSGAGWSPIGSNTIQFTGHYDGQGRQIDGLCLNRTSSQFLGFFGRTNGATISNLVLTQASIHGGFSTGILAGYINYGSVSNCSVSGAVLGGDNCGGIAGYSRDATLSDCASTAVVSGARQSGGLAGFNDGDTSLVQNCYATGNVTGTTYVGGLLGRGYGAVVNAYSVGLVTGTASVGGLIGASVGTTTHSMWDLQTSGQTSSSGGSGLSSPFMRVQSTFINNGWDFTGETANGTNDDWTWISGVNNSYPFLTWQSRPRGSGVQTDPYQIAGAANLKWVGEHNASWSGWFIQTADIDASATQTWNNGSGWSPIGSYSLRFSGVYDGQNHIISGLCINRASEYNQGLFGYIFGATLSNLRLTNASIQGNDETGALAGYLDGGAVTNCHSSGVVRGNYHSGGLLGYTEDTVVTNCHSDCEVHGFIGVGGLVGDIDQGSVITSCYATGSVYGTNMIAGGLGGGLYHGTMNNCFATGTVDAANSMIGGLLGQLQYSSVSYCYSIGAVTQQPYNDGGLVAQIINSSVTHSFWDTQTSGQSGGSGGVGIATAQMHTMSNFIGDGWDFTGETANGAADFWLHDGYNNGGYPYLSWMRYHSEVSGLPAQVAFGSVYMGQLNTGQRIVIQNTGTDYLAIANLTFAQGDQGFVLPSLVLPLVIAPSDTASFAVDFQPLGTDDYTDVLNLSANSLTTPTSSITLTGHGVSVAPSTPQNVLSQMQGRDVLLTWDPVTTNVDGQAVRVDGYAVLYSEIADADTDDFYFLTISSTNSFRHQYVLNFSQHTYYRVLAVINLNSTSRRAMMDLTNPAQPITWKDVKKQLLAR